MGTDDQNHPDEDISHDPRGQSITMNGHGAVPEQGRQRPGIRPSHSRQMDESRKTPITPVGDILVDEMGGEDDLRAPEMVADPEEDPREHKQVIQDEMAGYVSGGGDQDRIFGEEMDDVADLGEEEEDPRMVSGTQARLTRWGTIPVDASDVDVLAKWGFMFVGLLEEAMTVFDIIGRANGVVDASNNDEDPADGDQDPIRDQGRSSVSLSSYKGII